MKTLFILIIGILIGFGFRDSILPLPTYDSKVAGKYGEHAAKYIVQRGVPWWIEKEELCILGGHPRLWRHALNPNRIEKFCDGNTKLYFKPLANTSSLP